jgi:Zn-dependent alcohol dehydrogenase
MIDGARPRVMPMVLGHEAAGEVVEIGPGVAEVAPGDHVVLTFVPSRGTCGPCLARRAAPRRARRARPRTPPGRCWRATSWPRSGHRLGLDELNAGFDRLARGQAVRQAVIF